MGRFVPNPAFARQMASDPKMRDALETAAETVAGSVTGGDREYQRSIAHTVASTKDGWVGRVQSSSSFWHIFEFGSVKSPAYAPLRRALEKHLRRTSRTRR